MDPVSWLPGTRYRLLGFQGLRGGNGGQFLSLRFLIKRGKGDGDDDDGEDEGYVGELRRALGQNGYHKSSEEGEDEILQSSSRLKTMNTSKHLWAGAASAIVSR